MMRLKLLSVLLLSSATIPALALPGEATAVLARCGAPTSDTQSTSEVTNLPQRTLAYGAMRLNFEPADGGWSFTTGWHNHLPLNQNEVASRMPCFAAAMTQVAKVVDNTAVDPTIQAQTAQPVPTNRATFGIANLWLILFLFGIIAIFAVAIPRTRKMVLRPKMKERPFRRPRLNIVSRFRRRPNITAVVEKP